MPIPDSSIEDSAPSATALRVAVLRALHQSVDIPPVFIDPLAERILGPHAKNLVDPYRVQANETSRLRATLAARAIFAATAVAEAVRRGVRQCVILGAGLDTFAYRSDYPDIRVFEVDRPEAQAWKKNVLRQAKIKAPSTLAYVAVNLEHDDVLISLATAGFDRSQPAVFVMLGVSFYVDREALLILFDRIGEGAQGNELIFDYSEPLDRAPKADLARYRKAAKRVAAVGEPWITFFTPSEIEAALRGRGFDDMLDLDASMQNARWFAERTDGLAVVPLAHLVRARVTPPR